MDLVTNSTIFETIASILAVVGLIIAICVMLVSDKKVITQLLGSILVVSLALAANLHVVYVVSVFVVATLVTEILFLEKLAALIWNRKEFWAYLSGNASNEEVKAKTEQEISAEIEKEENTGADDVESIEDIVDPPAGITDIEDSTVRDKNQMVSTALNFEKSVLESLVKNKIPFPYKNIRKEVRLVSGSRSLIIDAIIETPTVHYLLEIKYITRPSILENAAHQINYHKEEYESYLSERNVRVAIQPLILVPDDIIDLNFYKGIPIVKFNSIDTKFHNLKATYSEYELNKIDNTDIDDIESLLRRFLSKYSKWAFSPLRIQKWGGKQQGFNKLSFIPTSQIRHHLENMLRQGIIEERFSQKGNKLYRIKL
ncbi:hypothetical protein CYPRO_2194 [Cyclonatronum proteinivorum]|uniref:Nuclease-related domain-containing protein n=1 Tax=Cyclonatronum proteinivorum TaxID=1457365 RepID=A0A345ULU0_9BACT|nr:hypothetical protein [Cyclonatronum proteinivorum]AXJ01442.1 hypothetical protein CYPRO_2194 [Cyclonatronum proteinivorum]